MTQMRDSRLDPRWLAEMMRLYPPKKLANGLMLTGPVRLAFVNLFKPRKPRPGLNVDPNAAGKFGCAVLFPIGADLSAFRNEWLSIAKREFPKYFNGDMPIGLEPTFHDQAIKTVGARPFAGFTPGGVFFNSSSQYAPKVVDMNMNPITDESRAYDGVWAIVSMNAYSYNNMKTGVGFGLQNVMLVADDVKLGGGGSDPSTDFAGITISAQTNIADKMASAAIAGAPRSADVMPPGGFVGQPGALPVEDLEDIF